MKRILMAVVAVAVVAMAGSAMAAGQTSINVSARVVGTCKFNSPSSTLSLGDLPFNATTGVPSGTSAAGYTTFWCTNNATFSITDDDGMHESGANANRLLGVATGEWIDYSFTYTPTSGLGLGPTTNIVLDYTATVGPTYANNSADTYNDTVVLTINP